jgi:hypothetical protein
MSQLPELQSLDSLDSVAGATAVHKHERKSKSMYMQQEWRHLIYNMQSKVSFDA